MNSIAARDDERPRDAAPEPSEPGPPGRALSARLELMARLGVCFENGSYVHRGRRFEWFVDAVAQARHVTEQERADGSFHPTPAVLVHGQSS